MSWNSLHAVYVSPKVCVSDLQQKVVDAFKAADPKREVFTCLRIQERQGVVCLSTYTEGYIPRKIYGRTAVFSSVGGDYNIAYKATADQIVEERKLMGLQIRFEDNGTVDIILHPGDIDAGQVLFKGRGFGRKGASVIKDIAAKFKHHQSKYV